MSSRRRAVVYLVMALVLGGNLVCFALGRQRWPYSYYPMFSDTRGADLRTFHALVLVGEPEGGGETWLGSRGELGPALPPMLVASAFARAREQAGQPGVDALLRETFDFVERARTRGESDAPPLRRLALYEFRWKLRPDLANVRHPARELLAAYSPAAR